MSKCSLFEDFLRILVLFLRRRKRRCHPSPSSIMVQRHNCSIHRHSSSLAALKHIPPSCDCNPIGLTTPLLSTKSHHRLQTLCMAGSIKNTNNQVQLPNLSIVPSQSTKLHDHRRHGPKYYSSSAYHVVSKSCRCACTSSISNWAR